MNQSHYIFYSTPFVDCFSEACNTSPLDCSRRGRLLYPVASNITSHTASCYQSTDAASIICYDDLLFSTYGIRPDQITGTKCGQLNSTGDVLDCCHFCHQQMENILLSRLIETFTVSKETRSILVDERTGEGPYKGIDESIKTEPAKTEGVSEDSRRLEEVAEELLLY